MEKKKIRFGLRFEKAVQTLILRYLGGTMRGLSRLVEQSLSMAMKMHEAGHLLFSRRSDFLVRDTLEDRIDVMLCIDKRYREYARVLAFVYDLSMAEVIRITLEEILARALGENNEQKNHYDSCQFRIQEVHISLISPYPNIRIHINPAFPPGGA